MAVIAPQQKVTQRQEEERRGQMVQTLGSGPMTGPGAPGGVPAASGGQSARQTPGSRFGRLKQYMEANKPQAESMGQRLTGGAETKARQAKEDVQEAGMGFQAEQGRLRQEIEAQPELSQRVFSGAEQYTTPEATEQQQQDVSQFQRMYGGQTLQEAQTMGPDLTEQQATQADVARMGEALSTGKGRFELLGERFGSGLGPQYTAGQKALDLLLLQSTPGVGKGAAERLAGAAAGLGQDISALETEAGTAREEISGLAQAQMDAARQLFGTGQEAEAVEGELAGRGLEDIQAAIEAQQAQMLEQQPIMEQQLKEALGRQVLTQDQMEQLGLGTGYKSYGLDLSEWLGASAAPTLAQAASPEEMARLRALEQLTGESTGFLEGVTDIGGYSPVEWKDVGGKDFRQAVQERKDAYEGQLRDIDFASGAQTGGFGGVADLIRHRQQYAPGVVTDLDRQFLQAYENVVNDPTNPQTLTDFMGPMQQYLDTYGARNKMHDTADTLRSLLEEYDPTRELQRVEQATELKPFI